MLALKIIPEIFHFLPKLRRGQNICLILRPEVQFCLSSWDGEKIALVCHRVCSYRYVSGVSLHLLPVCFVREYILQRSVATRLMHTCTPGIDPRGRGRPCGRTLPPHAQDYFVRGALLVNFSSLAPLNIWFSYLISVFYFSIHKYFGVSLTVSLLRLS